MFLAQPLTALALLKLDDVIPQHDKLREQLISYVNEHPVMNFVTETLSVELHETQACSRSSSSSLIEIEGYSDTNAVAERLISQLESLPWHYTVTMPVPDVLGDAPEFRLSPSVRLVRSDAGFESEYPLNSASAARNSRLYPPTSFLMAQQDVPGREWDSGVYLQLEAEGFIGPYGGSEPDVEVRRLVKAFCGLGFAFGMFDTQRTHALFPTKYHLLVHRRGLQGWEIDNRLELEDDAAQRINNLRVVSLAQPPDSEAARARSVWDKLLVIFADTFSDAKSEKILLAAAWLFDSYAGQDELLSFVRAMVVLEILLGEDSRQDEIGLGELLRNRCAYLVAKTLDDRERILKDFTEIYRVRSQIVHRGKHRLNMAESANLGTLRWMCRRVIQEEVRVLRNKPVPGRMREN